MVYGIPIYFQVAGNEDVAKAGSRIVPVVVGNAIGTITGGYMINRTGHYKIQTLVGQSTSILCFTLMALRWHGRTNWAESLYVSLAGFGIGTTQSTSFMHLAARLENAEIAIASSIWFLSQSFGTLVGASLSTTLINSVLKHSLEQGLGGLPHKDTVRLRRFLFIFLPSDFGEITSLCCLPFHIWNYQSFHTSVAHFPMI